MSEDSHIGIAGVKIRIMPDSPEVDLEELRHKIRGFVEEAGGINNPYEIEPVAFGLKAIIAFFQWKENRPLEEIEEKIKELDHVQSIQTIDIRKIA